ncbi:hypothetical protein AKJ29_11720 [Aliiroseovarius crassostreae]|uniref:Methyltransferase FkbM domain-containing protein n=1 Tax=Aliiroseovarius crassostreae TaxID=154981 RepID=A0A0P7J5M0_9RHOB|nr:hypothetical protein [Aliiroseovarius crassostreae]KPN63338.1 hypothetical protein AKJ29_11720 [Aliiroseovarius crassostreae]
MIQNAEWVIHIDVDEFINVRCGNGTMQDFLDRVPNATNVAMTWRLFGHNGVTEFADDLVIDQFDTAAPKYAPKPHTVWGFKTMTKNVGANEKLSCHRPNKLRDSHRDQVVWVNGSGQVMTDGYKDKGWRSDLKTVGYDLLLLNHYALRSAESYLIKRQRGRALHVDCSIGINYWVRMDWGGNTDVTIKRNIPRTVAELGRLMTDKKLVALHQSGVYWHRAKAAELRQPPELSDLYNQALDSKLTEMEHVAYALALDMESKDPFDAKQKGVIKMNREKMTEHNPQISDPKPVIQYPDDGPRDVKSRGMRFPDAPRYLTPARHRALRSNAYEERKTDAVKATVTRDDVVLGAGVGVMSTFMARKMKVKEVHAYEANPHMIPYIEEVYSESGVKTARIHNAILGKRKGATKFYVRSKFLASSLEENPKGEKAEVTEAELLPGADLSSLRAAVIELHPQWIGQTGVQAVVDTMHKAGLTYFPRHSNAKVVTFKKGW